MSFDRCRVCENFLRGVGRCKFCEFEWSRDYPPCNDVAFDVFDLDDDVEWGHLQILDRLHFKGIECLKADIWFDSNLILLWGCSGTAESVANALGVSVDVVYTRYEDGLFIVNLFQEKFLRGEVMSDE